MKQLLFIILSTFLFMHSYSMPGSLNNTQLPNSNAVSNSFILSKCYRTVTVTTEYWIPCPSNPQYGGWYSSTNTCTASANSCESAQTAATSCAIGANYADCLEAADANPPCPSNEP